MNRRRLSSVGAASFLAVLLSVLFVARAPAADFLRGDSDSSGTRNITDAIRILGFLFLGRPERLDCLDAADVDDDGKIAITDPISLLRFLFSDGGLPPAPFAACGKDPTSDPLDCERFPHCPQAPSAIPPPQLEPVPSPTTLGSVQISGRTLPGLSVKIDGGMLPAAGAADAGGLFQLEVTLFSNRLNRLFATASDAEGRSSPPSAIEVIQDGQPPEVFIDEPADVSALHDATVTVAGRVADVLSGFKGLAVTVNGQTAEVVVGIGTNGTFERQGVPLALGENTITAEATDCVGNRSSRTVRVRREELPADQPKLQLVSGNGQGGRIHELLGKPIVIEVLKADGSPFAGKLVDFEVTRSDGRLALDVGTEKLLLLQRRTDAAGRAQAFWTLGSDAGCGNNRVLATAVGVAGAARFCASALPGPAAQINVGSGNNQRGEAGAEVPESLRAWVSDGCNGVAGVPVMFGVADGGGKIDGQASVVVTTGPTGHAAARWTLGKGFNEVEASFPGNRGRPAVFTALGLERRSGAVTRFTGLVLDNAAQPIGGAACILELPEFESLQVSTAADGRFAFDGIPGSGLAFLRIEGAAATRLGDAEIAAGSFPALSYDVILVPGAENSLPAPVLLPRLDSRNARSHDGSQDVTLEVAGVEGLSLRVLAGSVTLADGSRPSPARPVILSLNQVHHDDVPMPMPDGASPPFAWTLQPAGARFDPPVAITFPNMTGLPAGAVSYFLSFNHDTGRFEIVASGRVTADGASITSDPGAGIRAAGWGGSCPPYPVTGDTDYCEGSPAGGGSGGAGQNCCPKAPRFVHLLPGGGPATYRNHLEISTFVTRENLDEATGHIDPDNFKLEVVDGSIDQQDDDIVVHLEALRADATSFSPRREMTVTLHRVADTTRFRSGWLRLVVDEVDDGVTGGGAESVAAQTLLVSTDPNNSAVEILGQIVRATYSGCKKDRRVGTTPLRMDVRVHLLSDVPATGNDDGVGWNLSTSTARRVVETWVRHLYAQASITVGQLVVDTVSPVNNLIGISQSTGLEATGGSPIVVQATADRSGQQVTWSLVHVTGAGATPFETAQAIASEINLLDPDPPGVAGNRLLAEAFENPARTANSKHPADVLIRDPMGGKISVTVSSTDGTQEAEAPEANAHLISGIANGGSIEERALARNYAAQSGAIDIFVADDLVTEDGFTGPTAHAYNLDFARAASLQEREPLLGCVFTRRFTADDTFRTKTTFAHEIGHLLLDATHVTADDSSDGLPTVNATTQLMNDGSGGDARQTTGGRRFQDGKVTFDRIGGGTSGSIYQIERLRVSTWLHP